VAFEWTELTNLAPHDKKSLLSTLLNLDILVQIIMSLQEAIGIQSRPHVLCTSCESYWQRASCLGFTIEELCRGGNGVPSMPQHLLHSHDRAKIELNASLGCHFCSIIFGSVVGCTGDHSDRTFFATHGPLYISIAILSQDARTFLLTLFPCEQVKIDSHDLILNSYPLRLCPSTCKA
jgi:hypothetical protein